MRPDYCPVSNEPCQSMCLDWCSIKNHASEKSLLRKEIQTLREKLRVAEEALEHVLGMRFSPVTNAICTGALAKIREE